MRTHEELQYCQCEMAARLSVLPILHVASTELYMELVCNSASFECLDVSSDETCQVYVINLWCLSSFLSERYLWLAFD